MLRRLAAAAALLLWFALITSASAADRYALVIGVSEYPKLGADVGLPGARNDVIAMRDYWQNKAPQRVPTENLVVLANGVEGARQPTRANILGALGDLAAKVGDGDYVVIHYSGYGARQPSKNEGNGFDQLVLPSDAGKWSPESRTVENAIYDDEIGAAFEAVRAKGAFVWAIWDVGYAGTVVRIPTGGGALVRDRRMTSDALGIPSSAMEASARQAGAGWRSGGATSADLRAGSSVVFSATRSYESTSEMDFGAIRQGLFTRTLLAELQRAPRGTFRQLAGRILANYAAQNLSRPTPRFDGMLDVPVFPLEAARPDPPKAPADFDASIAVARPVQSYEFAEQVQAVNAILDEAAADPSFPAALRVVDAGAPADVRLAVARERDIAGAPDNASAEPRLWFLPPTAEIAVEQTYGAGLIHLSATEKERELAFQKEKRRLRGIELRFSSNENASEKMAQTEGLKKTIEFNLRGIASAANLARLALQSQEVDGFSFSMTIKRANQESFGTVSAEDILLVFPGDQIHMQARNVSKKPIDLLLLYIASDNSMIDINTTRLEPGATIEEGVLQFTDTSFGIERFVALAQAATTSEPRGLVVDEQASPSTEPASSVVDLAYRLLQSGKGVTRLSEQMTLSAIKLYTFETALH